MAGPLENARIIEIAGIGPGPFAGMVLSDMGADVIRVDRPGGSPTGLGAAPGTERFDVLNRNRRTIEIDLKHPDGPPTLLRIIETADGLIEGFRPGVAERLGFGPDVCLEHNPRLVYGRMTGYGREGPLAERAGHDLTYLSIAGVQAHIGRAGQPPTPPLNLVADFGGGGMFLAFGMVCALWERERSGRGQVVDAAMIDGAATLMAPLFGAAAVGAWGERGTNMLDSGAPWYDCYETADGEWMAVGAIEPQFYVDLLDGLGLAEEIDAAAQHDQATWPALRARLTARFSERTRAEWDALFRDRDACVAPVLSMSEAPHDPHNVERGTFVDVDGVVHPSPAPRFGRSRPDPPRPGNRFGSDADEVLEEAGFDGMAIAALRASGVVPPG